jgi:D-serine deaminase-like pyridoxal phosphate-dependent protein
MSAASTAPCSDNHKSDYTVRAVDENRCIRQQGVQRICLANDAVTQTKQRRMIEWEQILPDKH